MKISASLEEGRAAANLQRAITLQLSRASTKVKFLGRWPIPVVADG